MFSERYRETRAMLLLAYYRNAIVRSAQEALDWALGQGILLTILFSIGLLIIAVIYALLRMRLDEQGWRGAVSAIRTAVKDFITAGVIGTAVVLLLAFIVFFVKDAPDQVESLHKDLDSKGQKILQLQSQLDQIKDQEEGSYHVIIEKQDTAKASAPYGLVLIIQTYRERSGFKADVTFDAIPKAFGWSFVSQIPKICQNDMFEGHDIGAGFKGNVYEIHAKAPSFIPLVPIVIWAQSDKAINVSDVKLTDY
jgi:hypothetical protein